MARQGEGHSRALALAQAEVRGGPRGVVLEAESPQAFEGCLPSRLRRQARVPQSKASLQSAPA